jgi:hypothetical protein
MWTLDALKSPHSIAIVREVDRSGPQMHTSTQRIHQSMHRGHHHARRAITGGLPTSCCATALAC